MPYKRGVGISCSRSIILYTFQRVFVLQSRKMRSAGVDGYFKKVILSEDLGVLKPYLKYLILLCRHSV